MPEFYVAVEDIEPIVLGGLDAQKIMLMALHYRTSQGDLRPIVVKRNGPYWRLVDGRHRTLGCVMAERVSVLAKEGDY